MTKVAMFLRAHWRLLLLSFAVGAIAMVPYILLLSSLTTIDYSSVCSYSLGGKMLIGGAIGIVLVPVIWINYRKEEHR